MSVHETITKAETIVINQEAKIMKDLLRRYENAQYERDDDKLDSLLQTLCDEKSRQDPKGKYDHEEVWIARHTKKKNG